MAYSEEEKNEKFAMIIKDIAENGLSLRKALGGYGMPDATTFFKWITEDAEKSKQYAHACEMRAETVFEEILEIADKQGEDVVGEDEHGNHIINHNVIQRNRLQVDARKWVVARMNPKKFGDKVDVTTGGEKLPAPSSVDVTKLSTDTLRAIADDLESKE